MAEESNNQMELGLKGEAVTKAESPTHAHDTKHFDSSSRTSLSSGTPGSVPRVSPSRDSSKEKDKSIINEREERVRQLREKQAEERQRKLEELKTAAFQAQRYREIQEEERRKKIEEIKTKESERRHLVEERKKQIYEADMERRENLLRRSQDREARIEAQRNAQRSSIGFAFGSSTPRLLDCDSPYMFSSRRAASQLQIYPASSPHNKTQAAQSSPYNAVENDAVVRRRLGTSHSVDRGMEPAHRHTIHESFFYGTPDASKNFPNSLNNSSAISDKIAHSHHTSFPWEIVEQQNSHIPNAADIRMSGLLQGSGVLVGDIMTQSLTSLSNYNRGRRRTDLIPTVPILKESPRTRSPAASSPSRPQSSMSQQSLSSHSTGTSSVILRTKSNPRKPRPLSVAGTTPDKIIDGGEQRQGRSSDKRAGIPPSGKPPRAKSVGPDNVLKEVKSNSNENGPTSPVSTPRRATTPKLSNNSSRDKPKLPPKPNLLKQNSKASPPATPTNEEIEIEPLKPIQSEKIEAEMNCEVKISEVINIPVMQEKILEPVEIPVINGISNNEDKILNKENSVKVENGSETVQHKVDEIVTTVTPSKPKITTEEEAKAVLAERRRKAREEAERQAELEKQRQEELQRLEEERIRREEEEQRQWEEEVGRQRKAEEERLQRAIEEQQKREEDERLKKEEEARLKAEREKAEQQAREEQERLRKEAEEKFSREEEERAKRRKRVEDIMARTRARDKAKKEEDQAQTPTQNEDIINSFGDSFRLKTEDASPVQLDVLNNRQQNNSLLTTNSDNWQQTVSRVSNTTQEESLLNLDTIHTNGFNNHHQFHVNIEKDYHSNTGESILDSQCLSGFDILTPTKLSNTPTSNYESSASSGSNISNLGEHLSNEDDVNFNKVSTTNGIDNYPNHQETGVTDLLS